MIQTTIINQYEHELQRQVLNLFHADACRLHDNHFGPKVYTNAQRIALLVLKVRSKKSFEDFANSLFETKWPRWRGLREIPVSSSIHRWVKKFHMRFIRKLNRMLLRKEQPEIIAVDGTGIDSWQRSRHYERRIGQSPMPYAKLDILVDTNKLFVHDWVLRTKPRHDIIAAKAMIKRTRKLGALLLGDKAYDCESLHELAEGLGMRFYAPVKRSPNSKFPKPKKKHRKKALAKGCAEYPQRNMAETTIRSIKSRIHALKSKMPHMKKREMAWNILTYNLEKVCSQVAALYRMLIRASFGIQPLDANV